jgi:hypothetical protein
MMMIKLDFNDNECYMVHDKSIMKIFGEKYGNVFIRDAMGEEIKETNKRIKVINISENIRVRLFEESKETVIIDLDSYEELNENQVREILEKAENINKNCDEIVYLPTKLIMEEYGIIESKMEYLQ